MDRCHEMINVMEWDRFPHYGSFCGGNPTFTGGFLSQRACKVKFSCFIWCQAKEDAEQTMKSLVTGDAVTLIYYTTVKSYGPVGPYRYYGHNPCENYMYYTISSVTGFIQYSTLPGMTHRYLGKWVMKQLPWSCVTTVAVICANFRNNWATVK